MDGQLKTTGRGLELRNQIAQDGACAKRKEALPPYTHVQTAGISWGCVVREKRSSLGAERTRSLPFG